MTLVIGLVLLIVAVIVFIVVAVGSFLERNRTLGAMEGSRRRRRFAFDLWMAHRKSPTTLFLMTAVLSAVAGMVITHEIV